MTEKRGITHIIVRRVIRPISLRSNNVTGCVAKLVRHAKRNFLRRAAYACRHEVDDKQDRDGNYMATRQHVMIRSIWKY